MLLQKSSAKIEQIRRTSMSRFHAAKAQSLHLYDDELVWGSYSGTDVGEEQNRKFETIYISSAVSYRVAKRHIHIYGVFRLYATGDGSLERKVRELRLLRVLEDEDERKMLRFLDGVITPEAQGTTRAVSSKGSRQGDGRMAVSFMNSAFSPKKKRPVRKALHLFILAIFVLGALAEGSVLLALALMLFGVGYAFLGDLGIRVDYIPTRMEFSEREFEVYYMNVDRRDKRGLRTEHYTVQYKNIRRIRFDETRHKFCVSCLADMETAFADGNSPEDGKRPSPDDTEFALYLTDDVLNRLTEKFTWICESQGHIENNILFV